ncbi:hypothetical protein C3747_324g17 [Trypanosoma cruzi]|uniref:DUF676 domain-containing protein n=2 Tax=Trypanosoma cruzi TaxID=5693 RepID=Q4D0M4_TRYCC|nr:hypothetical protein Tc00.1047053509393.40 [Trypanosoma cruzi]EAN86078.1 hypothetical protein Tc00.1047053509393.40 [Trypanosoma cruzi]KAF5223540.1 hypothetical protein ECC02_003272 [Trypanosoma cruzi]PWU92146.1 hypothetical protein C3747_324g17 [Trypanosoma cruzi]|eukprot:XP_807929.1 hypothetical protein [Trypanosoma cruzi strain CL Brener]
MRASGIQWDVSDDGVPPRQGLLSRSSNEKYPSLSERVFLLYNGANGDAEFDIVLLHGLGSGEFKCWTNKEGLLWPAAFLPQEFPRCRILSAGYTHALWRWQSFEKMKEKEVEEMGQQEDGWAASSIRRWVAEAIQGKYPSSAPETGGTNHRKDSEDPQGSLFDEIVPSTAASSSEDEIQTLEQCAADLAERLLSDAVGVGRRPLVFIAYSFGGLVIKQMIILAAKVVNLHHAEKRTKVDEEGKGYHGSGLSEELFLRSIRGIVFYATPHFGSPIASAVTGLKRYYQTTGGPSPSELVTTLGDHNREQLQSLNEQFFHVIERCSDIGYVRVLSFGETRRLNGVFRIVEPESANPAPDDPRFPFYLVDADHTGVHRPISKEQPSYTILFGFIKRMHRTGLLFSNGIKNAVTISRGEQMLHDGKTLEKEAAIVEEPFLKGVSISNHESKEALEMRMLLGLLNHSVRRIRTHSTTLFGYMMPMQLNKLLALAKDIVDYATTSLNEKENDACLLTPVRLVLYWAERAVSTLETFFICQAERSVVDHFSVLESRTLHDIECGVAELRREWEWFYLQLCQTYAIPDSYPVVIFFSQSITLAVADAMMDEFGFLLVLAIQCVPEACGWQRDLVTSWGLQENPAWLPPSFSMVASLLTGWMHLGITRKYRCAITAFQRLIHDIEVLQRDEGNLLHTTSPRMRSITQEAAFRWWWSGDESGDKAKKMSMERKGRVLQVFALLAHAGLCWSQFLSAQNARSVKPFNLPSADTYGGMFLHSLMEGRRRYELLERNLHVDSIMDRPFASMKRVAVSPSHAEGKPYQTEEKESQKRSAVRKTVPLKGAALRHGLTFNWDEVREGESREEAANLFTASVFVSWWIIERTKTLQRSLDPGNGADIKEEHDKDALHGRSPWVWENAHPRVKSQWLTWWSITGKKEKKTEELHVRQIQLLMEALRLHNANALALCLTGRHHLWRRNLTEAAEAYLCALESTRRVDNPLYRFAAVGLGWVHLYQYHCGMLEGSGVDFLALQGAPSGLRDCHWLGQWKRRTMQEPQECSSTVTAADRDDTVKKETGVAPHLGRASALFEAVLSFDPRDKGALCGMGRVKMLGVEAACTVDFADARRYFATVLGGTEILPGNGWDQKGNWDNGILAFENGQWESRAAYWMGEIHRCSLDAETESNETKAIYKKDVKAWWEYAVKRCPQNDWALTSLGLLYMEHQHPRHHNDVDMSRQYGPGVDILQRSLAINAQNTWTLWGLAHLAPDVKQRQMCHTLLKKLLRW